MPISSFLARNTSVRLNLARRTDGRTDGRSGRLVLRLGGSPPERRDQRHPRRSGARLEPWGELARRAGLSRSVFARRFREKAGEAPGAYLTRWRMLLAADRLTDGGDPVAQTGRTPGYVSEGAFLTAFKRVMELLAAAVPPACQGGARWRSASLTEEARLPTNAGSVRPASGGPKRAEDGHHLRSGEWTFEAASSVAPSGRRLDSQPRLSSRRREAGRSPWLVRQASSTCSEAASESYAVRAALM